MTMNKMCMELLYKYNISHSFYKYISTKQTNKKKIPSIMWVHFGKSWDINIIANKPENQFEIQVATVT